MGYLHGFQILVLVFWASIFALHRVQCSSAFVSPSHSRCDVNVFVDSYSQFCENRRICVVCWAQSGHAANNRERFPERWFPDHLIQTAGCEEGKNTDAVKEAAEGESLRLIARLVSQGLRPDDAKEPPVAQKNRKAYELAKGKFVDLCCTLDGEKTLESLFDDEEASNENTHIIQGAIISLQSLAILGMQFGVKATAEQFERSVSHLIETRDNLEMERDYVDWDSTSTRRLKYRSERTPGLQLLSTLLRKRSAQGAYDLLVKLNAWKKHEDLALLRSGFSMRFSGKELRAAEKASATKRDPDELLGIRKDLRDQKVFTIDGASTSEIDDGLSVELVEGKYRIWIHIADADRWAPRDSELLQVAKKRGTSIYLPQGSIPMLPSSISSEVMSLKANEDVCALSLGVMLADDGSIDDSSIVVTSSNVRVSYRLTYDDVDEMLEDGIAYNEEWELGELYRAALLRRNFRIANGSAEAVVPVQIPQHTVATFPDTHAPDGVGITMNIQVSHNGGKNQSAVAEDDNLSKNDSYESPASSASTLVTEMMILAGEAIGKWKLLNDKTLAGTEMFGVPNSLRLPFRSQPKTDYRSRLREKSILLDLLNHNIGDGYCHAWYARRFFNPVKVDENANPHSGLGLDCYVQWSSPIRRFADLQVHCAVKRYLRRQRLLELMKVGDPIPSEITSIDLGCEVPVRNEGGEYCDINCSLDEDIDYRERTALIGATKILQRSSQKYWMLEFVHRLKRQNPEKVFEALVLGCTNPTRRQYAIYVYELGLEWRFVNPVGSLQAGTKLKLKCASVLPSNGQMTFIRINA